ncbi:sterol desaturase family protein [Parahaliea maris]|uniref:Sterol desaturase family protein n=1 Tax=Parahaliea maris TaxID=2716870 RepID=A0A5C9A7C9_9GAMM|nr:sterol desaturase family protein [Parahaliea maris]TXS95570.1 sterol desaturase family protein [Parahaliea maris]
MTDQAESVEAPDASAMPVTSSPAHSRWHDFLLTLPQPLLVLGSMFSVALVYTYQWFDPGLYAVIMTVLPLPLVLIAERIWGKREDWELSPREFAEDAFWIAGSGLLWVPLYVDYYKTPISEGFRAVRDLAPLDIELAPQSVIGLVFGAILVRTLAEFIYYWLHRAQHESLFWWRIHATHHHITKMGAARSDRTHPLEFLALMIGTPIILALTGASDALIAVTGAFGFFSGYLNHANLPLRSGIYGLYFTTAEQHHLHHSRDMDSSNSNYGCTIIIWDRIFGTYSGRTDIEAIGAGTGKALSIWDQYKMAFVSTDRLTKY